MGTCYNNCSLSLTCPDWKCQIRFYDSSIEDDDSVSINVFRPKDEFPKVGCGDIVLIRRAKVRGGYLRCGFLTNYYQRFSNMALIYGHYYPTGLLKSRYTKLPRFLSLPAKLQPPYILAVAPRIPLQTAKRMLLFLKRTTPLAKIGFRLNKNLRTWLSLLQT